MPFIVKALHVLCIKLLGALEELKVPSHVTDADYEAISQDLCEVPN